MRKLNTDWMQFAHPLGFIRLILLVDWDPIGIFGELGAMDEYDAYAVEIYDLLQSDKSTDDIASCLKRIQSEQMEVTGRVDNLTALAGKIYRTYHTAHEADTK